MGKSMSKTKANKEHVTCLFQQVATTIGEMAKLGWRHCDISYNNILVDPVTKQALLADFNLAVKVCVGRLNQSSWCFRCKLYFGC